MSGAPADRRVDPDAVFERDEFTCQCCVDADRLERDSLVAYHLDSPDDGARAGGPSSLESAVTVCVSCHAVLRGRDTLASAPPVATAGREAFQTLRSTVDAQSALIRDVVAFAELATTAPTQLLDGDAPILGERYLTARRGLRVTLAALDGRLDGLAAAADGPLESSVAALERFVDEARDLQDALKAVVAGVEATVTALGRCHGCFAPIETAGAATAAARPCCRACGATQVALEEWRDESGAVAFDALFGDLNASLEEASRRTDRVTGRATEAAAALVG